jgi:hypothetical protein
MSEKRFFSPLVSTIIGLTFFMGMMTSWMLGANSANGQIESRNFITTKGLQLVNDKGEIRASLVLWDGEHPALIMGDATCDRRLSLAVQARQTASLTLFGDECKRRAVLEIQPLGVPEFVLRDNNDTPRARVQLLADGTPSLTLYEPHGSVAWKAPVNP